MKYLFLSILLSTFLFSLEIKQKPIIFDEKRVDSTKDYILQRYGLETQNINITPKIIVIHHTGINSLEKSFKRFYNSELPNDRPDIVKASNLNVSAHFLVDKDGTIYQLMNETYMARHVIGLNYNSIGIENIGGQNFENNLTKKQLESNIKLIKYLQEKYPTIKYLIGHYEYTDFENHKLWLEKDKTYRTIKHDPHPTFMEKIRKEVKFLKHKNK